MPMPGRNYNSNTYRYGTNKGSEKDNEIYNQEGRTITTFYREGDTYEGRWWSVDPKTDEQPWQSPYSYMDGNPILMNDPDGDCPWCIGALVGAVVDAGLQLTEIALTDKPISEFSWTSVGVSAASGAIGVGIATKIDKAIKIAGIASKATTAAIKVTTSAATDAATSAGGQLVKKGKVDAGEVLIDVVAGGTAGKVAGDLAEKVTKKSPIGKVLANQADRAERVVANSTRSTRQEAAKNATQKAENYAAKRGAAAGTASSGAASEAAKKINGAGEESKKK